MVHPLGVVEGDWVGEEVGVTEGEGVGVKEGVARIDRVGVGVGVEEGMPQVTTRIFALPASATRKLPEALGDDTPMGLLSVAK
jgi:hypothetical protein